VADVIKTASIFDACMAWLANSFAAFWPRRGTKCSVDVARACGGDLLHGWSDFVSEDMPDRDDRFLYYGDPGSASAATGSDAPVLDRVIEVAWPPPELVVSRSVARNCITR
jgi:hypothetical protein